jgi:hypothetical protein
MNYALDNPIKRNVYVPDNDTPFAPAFVPSNPAETNQAHRNMTWQHDNRQKVIGTQQKPQSARVEKKK